MAGSIKIPLTGIIGTHTATIQRSLPVHINNVYKMGTTTAATRDSAATHTPPRTVRIGNAFKAAAANLFS